MDEEEFAEVGFDAHAARRFRKLDLLVLALDTASNFAIALANSIATARDLTGMHVNYQQDRELFHEEAALEIETITGEEE